jgi:hypothetical protein
MKEFSQFSPFILKFIRNQEEQFCSLCPLSAYCFGCILEPHPKLPFYDILKEASFIAIEWNLEFLQQFYLANSVKAVDID